MKQLGISAFYHDAAACIVIDGKVKVAVEEERFTEIKHDLSFPINAINFCLEEEGLTIKDIDQVCWYEDPIIKKDRVLTTFNKKFFSTYFQRRKFLKEQKTHDIKLLLQNMGFTGEIVYTPHHASHSAYSYYTSPYIDSAILTIDGVGEWETATISLGIGSKIQKKISIDFPNSLGMFYSTITSFLGFKPNEGEYKVMGLAPYGDPSRYKDKLASVFKNTSNKFYIKQKYFTWEYSDKIMFNKKLAELLDLSPRLPEEKVTQEHKDLAAALQKIYEIQFLKLVQRTKHLTKSNNLCLGGGCAYNGVANTLAYRYFNSIHIPNAPSDAGSAIGACFSNIPMELKREDNSNPFLGPEYSNIEISKEIQNYKEYIQAFKLSDSKLIQKTAELINNQNIVAWFQGRMEFGARALGNRSILASPSDPEMRQKLNLIIKEREGFRPFAPSVIEEEASMWFHVKENIPYMNQVVQAKTKYLPAATHIDGSCRVHTVTQAQNKRYYDLIKQVGRLSNKAVVLNTSFNLKDQTITMTPKQAIERFISSKINFLVIGNFLIRKT